MKMKRLKYSKEMINILNDWAKSNGSYWRYQDSEFGGVIPVGHKSHERMYETDEPGNVEEGASCFDNPYQLFDYISNEYLDMDTTDVVLFTGNYIGSGIDDEDIVAVKEESDIFYSLTLRDFHKYCYESSYWFMDEKALKEEIESYGEEFKEMIFEK